MKVELVNSKGNSVELNDKVWAVDFNSDLVAQAVYVYNSNQRTNSAHTKTRGEVAGGGRKPWKQKGTGRARQGSIRSPLWYKGGVTFGPRNDRNWNKKLNTKMNRNAITSAVSEMLRQNVVVFADFAETEDKKQIRKEMKEVLTGNVTVVTDKAVYDMALRNIENVDVVHPKNLNVLDLAVSGKLVVDKDAVKVLEERLSNE